MTDDINMRFVTALRDIDPDKRKKLALQQAWEAYSHITNPESSFNFIAQMAECTTAEVRQYFIGQRRSLNVEQPPSPASTLSPPPSTSSDLTELSETFTSAELLDGLSHTDSQLPQVNEVVQSSESIPDTSIKENRNPKRKRNSKKDSPPSQALNILERPKRNVKSNHKSAALSIDRIDRIDRGAEKRKRQKKIALLLAADPIYPSDVSGDPHVQSKRCMNAMYGKFERCSSCLAKQTDTCRFVGFRVFGTVNGKKKVSEDSLVYGPTFQSVTAPDPPDNYDFEKTTDEQRGHILDMIAQTFGKFLKKEIPHFEYASLRKIPNREICQLCDNCDTTIFSGYWMCCVCGKEICLTCYDEWDVSKKSRTSTCSFTRPHNKDQMIPIYHYDKDTIQRLINETEQRMIDHGDNMDIDEFDDDELPDLEVPKISEQPNFELDSKVDDGQQEPISETDIKMESIFETDIKTEPISETDIKMETIFETDIKTKPISETIIKPHPISEIEELTDSTVTTPNLPPDLELSMAINAENTETSAYDEAVTPNLPPPTAAIRPHDRSPQPHDNHQKIEWKEDELTEEIFKDIWKKGYPFMLKETSTRLSNELWTPEYFKTKYGHIECECMDCESGSIYPMDVQKFFDGFEDINSRFTCTEKYPCLKLKDWPSTDDFANVFPNHFQDFMNALPFKEYTTRNGVLNLANRLPTDINRPDLGPKMYNAYGSEDADGGNGTTNLHLDMTDAVNMMAYAPKIENRLENEQLKPSAAVWDIYHVTDLPRVRRFLRKVAKERSLIIDNPIHDQCFYMDSTLRNRLLEEEGVSGWRIYQNPGDIVFVPAGCAHQVCNYTSCIKVAVDFVSPEGVARSFTVNKQFRKLSRNHKRRKDILQLPVILYHAWTTSYE